MHLLSPSSFSLHVLTPSLRIVRQLAITPQYDLFALSSLHDPAKQYTARAYTLRSVSQQEYSYRVRNLKRCSSKPCFLRSLEAEGRKWLISNVDEERDKQDAPKHWGSMPRSRVDYEKAFPLLIKDFAFQHRAQPSTGRKSYAACLSKKSASSASVPESKQGLTKRAHRARDRQRRARQAKRAAKASCKDQTNGTFQAELRSDKEKVFEDGEALPKVSADMKALRPNSRLDLREASEYEAALITQATKISDLKAQLKSPNTTDDELLSIVLSLKPEIDAWDEQYRMGLWSSAHTATVWPNIMEDQKEKMYDGAVEQAYFRSEIRETPPLSKAFMGVEPLILTKFFGVLALLRIHRKSALFIGRAFEGALLAVYKGDESGLEAMERLIQGSKEMVPLTSGTPSAYTCKFAHTLSKSAYTAYDDIDGQLRTFILTFDLRASLRRIGKSCGNSKICRPSRWIF